jgi:hypothetical protein
MSEKHTPLPWVLVLPLDISDDEFESLTPSDQNKAGLVAIHMATRLEYTGVYRSAHEIVLGEDMRPGEDPEMEANAALIVRAVNSHAELVAALETCADYLEHATQYQQGNPGFEMAAATARNALARAKVQP